MDDNIENRLSRLSRLQPCDPPPFLLTRIQEAIGRLQENAVSGKWRAAFAVAALLIISLNVFTLFQHTKNTHVSSFEQSLTAFHLSDNNQLYHDEN